ncbi:MAG: hypothetical protein WBQ44_19605 [Rhodococcus sp. (in: high G+C Gram-positive bacteria)]
MTSHAITPDVLGAWVIKCNPNRTDLAPMIAARRANERWCVASNYRTRLMAPGQPVLFWVSAHRERGLWGAGHLIGAPERGPQWKIATDIVLFDEPIVASRIRCVPALSTLEVFRSPQQSNPSWVTCTEWEALQALLPE